MFIKLTSKSKVSKFLPRSSNKSGGLHAPFTSSSAIGSWRVNPIIDAYFHLFTKKDHLSKICEIILIFLLQLLVLLFKERRFEVRSLRLVLGAYPVTAEACSSYISLTSLASLHSSRCILTYLRWFLVTPVIVLS